MDADLSSLKRYVDLRKQQRDLTERADEIKEQANELEQQLLGLFESQGLERLTVDGSTVYLHRETWAKVAEGHTRGEVAEALKSAGLGHMVKEGYNSNTLSAYLREVQREESDLPEALEPLLGTTDKFSLRVRRAD